MVMDLQNQNETEVWCQVPVTRWEKGHRCGKTHTRTDGRAARREALRGR